MTPRFQAPETCPVCGVSVPQGARACPGCGADEKSGWDEEQTRYDGLDLPDTAFDYDEALRDSGLKPRHVPKGVPVFWWVVGLVLLVVMAKMAFSL